MKNLSMRHTINCNAETFWKLFADEEFNRLISIEDMKYTLYRTLERKDQPDSLFQRVEMQPQVDAPAPIRKLMGDSFKLQEEGTLDRKAGVYRFKSIPSSMADKISIQGTIRLENTTPTSVVRLVEMSIDAKVFGLGGMIESSAAKSSEDGFAAFAKAMNRRIKERG